MSDANRKSLHSRMFDKVTPSMMKSRKEVAKENATGKADDATRDAQPDSTKGAVQEAVDKVDRAGDAIVHGDKPHTKQHKSIFGRKKC
ncbi:uncharacterized protein AB675_2021 [Cyphellophora attinorum]|uniref:Heat shock protein hsp9 n=1 Tax=Cyphellophora attinorum TaxID=1664694 RepID=A0A0N1HDR8_9EURO|nr:uncharacterized protein AB675_2021 [Phialophora attinorum]KPI42882.1 hypothetical protein AB675_2021 [Phialophora attinorum]